MRLRKLLRWTCGIGATLAVAPAIASSQTLIDPVGDNCRAYPMIGNHCGPDITQAVFTTPGDGNMHVDITYASLPTEVFGEVSIPQLPEYVEVGIYSATATSPALTGLAYRFSKFGAGWKLQKNDQGLKVVGDGTATPRALGIELVFPLAPLGDPLAWRYAVNAGNTGELIPEHPDLAPNSGLFALPAAPPPGGGGITESVITALDGIAGRQKGTKIKGAIEVSTPGTLRVQALVRPGALASTAQLKVIGKATKAVTAAGTVRFKVPLKKSAKRKLSGKKVKVTLRLALTAEGGTTATAKRKITLKVP